MGKIMDLITQPSPQLPFNLSPTTLFLSLGGVFVIGASANAGRIVLMRMISERIIARLRTRVYAATLRQDQTFFDSNMSGDLVSRLAVDVSVVGNALSRNIADGLRSLVMSGAGLSMMIYVSGQLTASMLVIVPPIALAAVYYGRYVRQLSKRTQTALGDANKEAEERIGNIRTVQAFARESFETQRYITRLRDVIDLAKKEATASGLFYAGTGLSGNLTAIAVLGLGGRMVMHGEITVGELTSFLLYTAYVGGSLMGMSSFYTELNKAIGASERVFDVLDSKPTIRFRPYALAKQHEPIQGAVTFKDVSFVYPTRADAVIFKGLSFSIQPGTVLGIAGTSGGGKSTITSLLLRYYDANTGHILIDNQDITSFNVHWWRQQVGVVSQEPVLFAGTIRENILYGRHTSTEEQVLQAVQNANCNFVHGFPQGLDTVVGERGHALSGGQKSRIAIARALLKDPRILILDEATSALDGASEHLVQDALDRLSKNRTVLTIAHRQSTLQKSELILCLDDGRVAEMGTFDALMRKRGVFYRLMAQQDLH